MLLRNNKFIAKMPITRSPQREQPNPSTHNPSIDPSNPDVAGTHQEDDLNSSEVFNVERNPPIINAGNTTSPPTASIEQVTLNFTKKIEEMQHEFSRQISLMLAMYQSNNAEVQKSISSLQNEIRSTNSNTSHDVNVNNDNLRHLPFNNILNIPSTASITTSNATSFPNVVTTTSLSNPITSANSILEFNINETSNDYIHQPTSHSSTVPQISSATSFPIHSSSSQPGPITVPHRQKKIYPLPKFCGSPEDWQTFYEDFQSSTTEFEYSDLHNIMRLRDSLEGNARETVESLLSNSKNVKSIIDILSETYGRPEQLIKSQIQKIRSLNSLEESDLNSLIVFANKVTNMTTFLESVGGNHHLVNPILLCELVSKLPISRRLQWADKCSTMGRMPTILDFSVWLSGIRKIVNIATDSLPLTNETKNYACVSIESRKCKLCDKQCKSLAFCNEFSKLPLKSRWEKVKAFKVCFSCLKGGHQEIKCFSRKQCDQDSCSSFHHKLLHVSKSANSISSQTNSSNTLSNETQARSCLADVNTEKNSVLFQIIPVKLYGPRKTETIYAFIDDGANVSMIDAEIIRNLGITGQKDVLELQWIDKQVSREQTQVVSISISGIEDCSEKYIMSNVYVSSKLDLPRQSFKLSNVVENGDTLNLSGMTVHDYNNVKPKMIISLAHAFLTVGIEAPRMLTPSGPFATKTKLGWIVYGPVKQNNQKLVSCHVFKSEKETESFQEIENLMKSYFGLETFGVRTPVKTLISKEDQRALEILNSTTKRCGKRFESGLLWRENFMSFPDSYEMALKRLLTVEKKMTRDLCFAKEYCAKIDEYVEKGYARIMPDEEAMIRSKNTFYLPHFGVMNPNKKKLRFVFDAAAEIENVSLNKALLPGPDINQPLLAVLLKFRESKVAVCGDLKEMFHQVVITKKDQDAQRFLWRDGDPSKPIKTYVMQRMIFGATCSPSMAQYVKNKNAEEFVDKYPRAVKAIIEKHYVDDYVDCFDTEEEAVAVVRAVKEIHKSGGFEMHNMLTNSKLVAKELGIVDSNGTVDVGKTVERILGMHWISSSDKFIFILKFHKVPEDVLKMKRIPTKRELLCIAMSVFDPFGFVADFMVSIKLLMQEVWKCKIQWDEKLPHEINLKFKNWMEELYKLERFQIPRFYFEDCSVERLQLHIFCDASEQAMATVAYWRVLSSNGIKISFIAGKTSCAPLRFHSIPKLELQAAVMAVRLKESILNYHEIRADEIHFWSDSHTVIRWIRADHRKYKQYVANRVSEILEFSDEDQWHWCPTLDNPADKGTRSIFPIEYNPEGMWKTGPKFLLGGEEEWPLECGMTKREDRSEDELKSKFFVMNSIICVDMIDNIIDRTSSYVKVRRQVAWILRFIKNLRCGNEKTCGELTVEEESNAENIICRQIQKKHFFEEYTCLESSKPIPKSSDLLTLNPFIDDMGVIRVGGRIDNATILPEYTRRPIILPKAHRYSRIIIDHYHHKNCHQNSSKVICDAREKFWIPSIRRLLKSVETQCALCKIRKTKPEQPQMSVLPIDRVTPYVRPFSYTGVDLFGPFDVKIHRRNEKRYVALFTCLTVRAVHLEVVNDLSSDAFIICLRNFINRRGVPIQIRSDNGRNFVGIKKELRNEANFLDHTEMTRLLTPLGIKWIFNTPFDPCAGGAWERLVQSIKRTLSVLLKEVAPKLEVFQSLLIESENIVNSRPLTHIPLSPQDPEPLTPNHFILGSTSSTQTPAEFDIRLINLRKQWRILQNLKNGFWGRWIMEYLPDLTRRVKWCLPTKPLQVGDIVLVCDLDLPRSKWKRGRVVNTYNGKDGIVRSADVKTIDGVFKRPTSKLAKLDLNVEL